MGVGKDSRQYWNVDTFPSFDCNSTPKLIYGGYRNISGKFKQKCQEGALSKRSCFLDAFGVFHSLINMCIYGNLKLNHLLFLYLTNIEISWFFYINRKNNSWNFIYITILYFIYLTNFSLFYVSLISTKYQMT